MDVLKKKVQDTFSLTDRQRDFLFKNFPRRAVERAYRSTEKWKTGDRRYFKEALKHYNKPRRVPAPLLENEYRHIVRRSVINRVSKQIQGIEEKSKGEFYGFDCDVCGQVKFHSRLKHDWLIMARAGKHI